MVYCFMQWRCYLEGVKTFLHTDHEPLTWLATQSRPNRRQARWMEFLSRFQYELLYVKGDENVVADALSRMLSIGVSGHNELPGENWPVLLPCRSYRNDPARRYVQAEVTRGALHGGVRSDSAGRELRRGGVGGTDADQRSGEGGRSEVGSRSGTRPLPSILTATTADAGWTRSRLQNAFCAGENSARGETRGLDSEMLTKCPEHGNKPSRPGSTRKPGNDSNAIPQSKVRQMKPQSKKKSGTPQGDISNGPTLDELNPAKKAGSDGTGVTSDRNASPPMNVTDPPSEGPTSIDGADPSMASYERLFDELFDEATRTEEQQTKFGLHSRDQLLWHGRKLYIPNDTDLRYDLLYWHHDVPWCAHLGIEKTMKLMEHQFYWPRMDVDIKKYISTCHKCQANKTDRRSTRPPLTPLVAPDACWLTLGVDLIVDLPPTSCEWEYNAICVFVCHLSKMVRLVPTKTTLTAKGFAKLFFKEVFPHYGMPQNIVSDRGPQWNSDFFEQICDILKIRLKLSTAYHPQTNGLVERTNEVVEAALRHFVAADHRNWDEFLPFIEFALNSAYHQATQSTPFRMNRITLPKNPFDALLDVINGKVRVTSEMSRTVGISTIPEGQGARTALEAAERFQWARRCVHLAKSQMKDSHDKKGLNLNLYSPGDKVWFKIKNLALRHPSPRHKLVPRYMGPFEVLECLGRSAVKLDLPVSMKIHPTVSISLLKPYLPREGSTCPPVVIDGFEEWIVQGITGHNVIRSNTKGRKGIQMVEFKIEWQGSYEASWHEFSDLEGCLDTLEKYLLNTCTLSERKNVYAGMKPAELALLSKRLRAEASAKPGGP